MVGYIGLGIMGMPMAKALLSAYKELAVYDLKEAAVAEMKALGAVYMTPREMGEKCERIHCILPTNGIVKEVLFGEGGVTENIKALKYFSDHSSVTPEESRENYQRLKALGVGFVDCPVSGAKDGKLAFMAGGDEEDYRGLLPDFQVLSVSSVLVGPSGSGSAAKLVNQVIVNLNIAVLGEAFTLGAKLGADPRKIFEAINGGLAGSNAMDAKLPKILDRDFSARGTITVNRKDINNVLASAHQCDCSMPLTAQLFEIMSYFKAHGLMGEDHCAYIKYFEKLAGVEVKG